MDANKLENWIIFSDPNGSTKEQVKKWFDQGLVTPEEAARILVREEKSKSRYTFNPCPTDFNN